MFETCISCSKQKNNLLKFLLVQSFSPGLGIHSSVFWANPSFFAQKWVNERFAQKNERFTHLLIFWTKLFWAYRSFAHFLWATWVNRSRSIICLEQPEWFAHGCSFPLSDLSSRPLICLEQSERIAHSHSFDLSEMSKWVNERIPSPAFHLKVEVKTKDTNVWNMYLMLETKK